jgi:phytoene synthase
MMAVLMGVRDPQALARATDLGIAMQLTNIARDVGEDARAGRLYLPLAWLRAEGIDPDAWLAAPEFGPPIARIVKKLLRAAALLYTRAAGGIAYLPLACRPGIRAAGLIYAAIGEDAARRGYDTVSRRAHVSGYWKLALLARSLAALIPRGLPPPARPLRAARYLVEATAVAQAPRLSPLDAMAERVVWLFDLFARLERQEIGAP